MSATIQERHKIRERCFKRLREIPAGIILLPLLLGSLIHTFLPGVLEIGSFTTALFSSAGTATLMALQLFCIGTQIRLGRVSGVLRRGGVLLLARVAAGVVMAIVFRLFARDGMIAGISALAAIAAVSNTNGSIFVATTTLLQEEEYAASTPILALTNGPLLTALILGASGAGSFSWLSLVALVLPMLVGFLLAMASARAAAFFEPGVRLTLPLIGFSLGAGIDLGQLWRGGLSGLLLGAVSLIVGVGIALLLDRLLNRGHGEAGIAACATGANAIAVPAAIALTNPSWQQVASTAAAQIGVSVILGAILVPLLAQGWFRRQNAAKSEVP